MTQQATFMPRQAPSLIAITAVWLLATVAMADSSQQTRPAAVDALFADYDRATTPGLAVGIYQGGRELYARGYGMADLENPAVITPDTVLYTASVSKHFVAFAILLLAREGKVNLDADIRTYLPYVPDFGDPITVRHLIHHTSGLRDQWSLFQMGGIEEGSRPRQAQVVNMVTRQRALNAKPGTEYNYCNTGYTLLAEIVRVVSGRTLREFTTERIFKPLQMQRTFFADDVTEIVPRRANSYEKDSQGRWRRKILTVDTVGASGLHATIGDFAKWAGNFARPIVGDAALIEQFTSTGNLDDGTPINYGFALQRQGVAGHQAVLHTGVHGGFRAVFAYLPAEDFSVTILANAPVDTVKSLERVVAIYLGEPANAAARKIPALRATTVLAAALPGSYQEISGSIMSFERRGKVVSFKDQRRNSDVPVVFRTDGTFDLGDEPRSAGRFYRPVLDARNQVIGLDAVSEDRVARYRRVQRVDPDTVNRLELAGDYRSAELDVTYTLSIAEGALVVDSIWFDHRYELQPMVKDGFKSDWPLQYVAIERDAEGRPSGLLVSTARARNVQFDRVRR